LVGKGIRQGEKEIRSVGRGGREGRTGIRYRGKVRE